MRVIPVLDLKDGVVVLASGGRRDQYKPIDTPLCRDSTPSKVARTLLELADFLIFYIADLNAIQGHGSNAWVIRELAHGNPNVEFWVDTGFAKPTDPLEFDEINNVRLVVGSESLASIDDYVALSNDRRFNRHILSLDRKGGEALGPRELITRRDLWPDTIIAMDLSRVGQATGPDLARIRELRDARQDVEIVAAGGVRNISDLIALAEGGVNFALVATALHNETLGADEISTLKKKRPN